MPQITPIAAKSIQPRRLTAFLHARGYWAQPPESSRIPSEPAREYPAGRTVGGAAVSGAGGQQRWSAEFDEAEELQALALAAALGRRGPGRGSGRQPGG